MNKVYDECLGCGQYTNIDEDLLLCDRCIEADLKEDYKED